MSDGSTGFSYVPNEEAHLFHVNESVAPEYLQGHLSCMLRGLQKMAEDGVDAGIDEERAWLMAATLSQAVAIADSLELPLRRK